MMSQREKMLGRAVTALAKTMEVLHWIAVGSLLIALAVFFLDRELLLPVLTAAEGEMNILGYAISLTDGDGRLIGATLVAALSVGAICCTLMAMIFRNIYLICRTSAGRSKFSQGATPFQADNVRMLREIGLFALAIPMLQWLCDVVVKQVVGWDMVESSVSVSGVVFGVALLCLSQVFSYGMQLQRDTDGLV